MPETTAENIAAVRARLAAGAGDVVLVAAGKAQSAEKLRAAHAAGVRHFGENYLQEAEKKIAALADLRPPPVWHFIGAVQRNKTAAVARLFSWAHAVDRLLIAQRLNDARGQCAPNSPLNVCLQVNIDSESGKAGAAAGDIAALAAAAAKLPHLRLRGLMAIPRPRDNEAARREVFRALARLHQQVGAAVKSTRAPMDTLSMGMSGDFGEAVDEGATMVRIGSAIFGARD